MNGYQKIASAVGCLSQLQYRGVTVDEFLKFAAASDDPAVCGAAEDILYASHQDPKVVAQIRDLVWSMEKDAGIRDAVRGVGQKIRGVIDAADGWLPRGGRRQSDDIANNATRLRTMGAEADAFARSAGVPPNSGTQRLEALGTATGTSPLRSGPRNVQRMSAISGAKPPPAPASLPADSWTDPRRSPPPAPASLPADSWTDPRRSPPPNPPDAGPAAGGSRPSSTDIPRERLEAIRDGVQAAARNGEFAWYRSPYAIPVGVGAGLGLGGLYAAHQANKSWWE